MDQTQVKEIPLNRWVVPPMDSQLDMDRISANTQIKAYCDRCGEATWDLTYVSAYGYLCQKCYQELYGVTAAVSSEANNNTNNIKWMYVDTAEERMTRALERISFLMEKYIGATYPDLDLCGYTLYTNKGGSN